MPIIRGFMPLFGFLMKLLFLFSFVCISNFSHASPYDQTLKQSKHQNGEIYFIIKKRGLETPIVPLAKITSLYLKTVENHPITNF